MSKIARPVRPLADVNVISQPDGSQEVVVCFMPDPEILVGEGNSKAFLALDASTSMKSMYGFSGPFGGDPNYVQAVARKLGMLLCDVTKSSRVNSIYWAVGVEGDRTEFIGEYDAAGWETASIVGPKQEKWGRGTKILPAVKYGMEQVASDADWTMGVILTDGIIEDEAECMEYCLQKGAEIASGKRKPVKLVLIGIGEDVDEAQLERSDDMFEGTGINYDLWSHGCVESMREEEDILAVLYGELVNEKMIVSTRGSVETVSGDVLVSWTDGMPGKFRFTLPRGEKEFVLRTPSACISQDISEAINRP